MKLKIEINTEVQIHPKVIDVQLSYLSSLMLNKKKNKKKTAAIKIGMATQRVKILEK